MSGSRPTHEPPFPCTWRVRTRLGSRFGARCRVLVRGRLNSCLVEFEDGHKVVTSRNYMRKDPTMTRTNRARLADIATQLLQHGRLVVNASDPHDTGTWELRGLDLNAVCEDLTRIAEATDDRKARR